MAPFRVNSKSIFLGKPGQLGKTGNRDRQVLMAPLVLMRPLALGANEARSEEGMVRQVAPVLLDLPEAVVATEDLLLCMQGIPPRRDQQSTFWLLEVEVAKVAKAGRVGKAAGVVAEAVLAVFAPAVHPTELMALKDQ
jgi:hypothetical protein